MPTITKEHLAQLDAFFTAFDEWRRDGEYHDWAYDDMTYDELQQSEQLQRAMFAARDKLKGD